MSDLISRSALIEAITDVEVAWDIDGNYATYDSTLIVDIINGQPTVEAKPVVKGEWLEGMGVLSKFFKCNKCGSYHEFKSSYCSSCGAKMSYADMRGGKNEENI